MDERTQDVCIKATNDFYQKVGESFSATREAPWEGWKKLFEIPQLKELKNREFEISDFACGNMRFEEFLFDIGCDVAMGNCIDNCRKLIPEKTPYALLYFESDLQKEPTDVEGWITNPSYEIMECDLSVCFGYYHHIPTFERRVDILEKQLKSLKSGGIVAISFWNFLNDEKISAKAKEVTQIATSELNIHFDDENDYFLGWQDEKCVYRYCHNFEEAEVDKICESVSDKAKVIAQFYADGKDNNLNNYVVLQKL